MSQAGQLPRGLSKDYKDHLGGLVDDGWRISRTRKGHLKLTHPETSQVIVGASTPSDFRAVLNLKAQCRSALRNGSSITSPVVEPPCDADCLNTLRMHKKSRRSMARKADVRPLARPPEPPVSIVPEESKMMTVHTDQFEKATAVVEIEASAKPVTTKIRKAPSRTARATSALAKSPIAPVQPAEMHRIPGNIFDLVRGVLAGEVQSFTVTPGMVGSKIAVKDGVIYLLEAGTVAPLTAPSPVVTTPSLKSGTTGMKTTATKQRAFEEMQDIILKFLKQYGEPMTTKDLVTLLPEHLKSKSDASTSSRVGQRCASLMAQGLITREKSVLNLWVYSAVSV